MEAMPAILRNQRRGSGTHLPEVSFSESRGSSSPKARPHFVPVANFSLGLDLGCARQMREAVLFAVPRHPKFKVGIRQLGCPTGMATMNRFFLRSPTLDEAPTAAADLLAIPGRA